MKGLVFPSTFLVFLALLVTLTACGDDGPTGKENLLLPGDIVIEKGLAVAIAGPGGDGGPTVQTEAKAIGITGTGYGKATASADAAVVLFNLSAWPKGYGPVAIACADCTQVPTQSPLNLGDLLTNDRLRTVIDAVVEAGGERDSIEIKVLAQSLPHMLPQSQPTFSEPKVNGTLSVTVREIDNAAAVAQAGLDAVAALTDIDAELSSTSVAYQVTDCATLRHAAGQAAVEDAADNAVAAGALLGLEAGAVVGVSDYIIQSGYQPSAEADCSRSESVAFTPGVGLTAPASDVEVAAQISVTYALESPAPP